MSTKKSRLLRLSNNIGICFIFTCTIFTFLGSKKTNAVIRGKVTSLIRFFNRLDSVKTNSQKITKIIPKSELSTNLAKEKSLVSVSELRKKFESKNIGHNMGSSSILSKVLTSEKKVKFLDVDKTSKEKNPNSKILSKYLSQTSTLNIKDKKEIQKNDSAKIENKSLSNTLGNKNKNLRDISKALSSTFQILEDSSTESKIIKSLDKKGNFNDTKLMVKKLEGKLLEEGNEHNEIYFKKLAAKTAKNMYNILEDNKNLNTISEPHFTDTNRLAKEVNKVISSIGDKDSKFDSNMSSALRNMYGIVKHNIIKGNLTDKGLSSDGVEGALINLSRNVKK